MEKENHYFRVAGLAILASALACGRAQGDHGRSVRAFASTPSASIHFDPEQSAALFVGVRQFEDMEIADVPYAADDAIDLAYAFAISAKFPLVETRHVILALRGEPHKDASKERLRKLRAAGAAVIGAAGTEILNALQQQADRTGAGGILIASFATHGFSRDGVPYVLAGSSRLTDPDSAMPATKIFEIASNAPRSFVFLDACRQRVTAASRSLEQPRSGAPAFSAMTAKTGQVVFAAAAAGKYAYDDERHKNGVFTENVIQGMDCGAEVDERGVVTASALYDYVEKRVGKWVRKHRDPSVMHTTQFSWDGDSGGMPVAFCARAPDEPCSASPARILRNGHAFEVIAENGATMWTRSAPIAEVADLDDDGCNEVVTASGNTISVYDAGGRLRWTKELLAPPNYVQARGVMSIRALEIGSAYRNGSKQILALSSDDTVSRITMFEPDGQLSFGYWHPGRVERVAFVRRTARTAPKIVGYGVNRDLPSVLHQRDAIVSVFMLDPKKAAGEAPPYRGRLHFGNQVWYGYLALGERIERLDVIDHDNDGNQDLALHTSNGPLFLDFTGVTIESRGVQFGLVK